MLLAYVSCSEGSGFVTSLYALTQFNTNELILPHGGQVETVTTAAVCPFVWNKHENQFLREHPPTHDSVPPWVMPRLQYELFVEAAICTYALTTHYMSKAFFTMHLVVLYMGRKIILQKVSWDEVFCV